MIFEVGVGSGCWCSVLSSVMSTSYSGMVVLVDRFKFY